MIVIFNNTNHITQISKNLARVKCSSLQYFGQFLDNACIVGCFGNECNDFPKPGYTFCFGNFEDSFPKQLKNCPKYCSLEILLRKL
jgi:hypothetical protein